MELYRFSIENVVISHQPDARLKAEVVLQFRDQSRDFYQSIRVGVLPVVPASATSEDMAEIFLAAAREVIALAANAIQSKTAFDLLKEDAERISSSSIFPDSFDNIPSD